MSTTTRSTLGLQQRQPACAGRHPEASETRRIIAATDIFDLAGTKLWARNQPVSAELQRKLLDRKAARAAGGLPRWPKTASPVARDGAGRVHERDGRLAPLPRPQASRCER